MSEDSRDRFVGDEPHEPTETDAGTGQGTASNVKGSGETQDRPIMDGSTMSSEAKSATFNPHRGQSDPALSGEPVVPPLIHEDERNDAAAPEGREAEFGDQAEKTDRPESGRHRREDDADDPAAGDRGDEPRQSGKHVEAEKDALSDPAHDDQTGSDWSGEGGATPSGPATDTDDA